MKKTTTPKAKKTVKKQQPKPEKAKTTRQPSPTRETCEKIFEIMIVEGKSVKEITRMDGFPSWGAFLRAVMTDKELRAQYDAAMEIRAMKYEEEIIDIVDNGTNDWMEANDPENPGYKINGESVQRSRLRAQMRQWIVSKLIPKFKDATPKLELGEDTLSALRNQLAGSHIKPKE